MRSFLYKSASILGWINAIAKGKILQRIGRVIAFRGFSSFINRIFK